MRACLRNRKFNYHGLKRNLFIVFPINLACLKAFSPAGNAVVYTVCVCSIPGGEYESMITSASFQR